MSEKTKTLIFAGIAAVVALVAYVSQPTQERPTATVNTNEVLFKDFADPGKAASLKIVKYNAELGEIKEFEVAKDSKTGRWEIPSSSNYPADAADQMRDVATMFLDLKPLGVATEVADDHKLFGVVEPDLNLKAGDTGVGMRVDIKDEQNGDLVKMVIGQTVRGEPEKRFVRRIGEDVVFVVKITPDKLSTTFGDWIEKDLLKIPTFDVDRLKIRDYSVIQANQAFTLDPRLDLSLSYNTTDAKWSLLDFTTYKQGKPQRNELLSDEELNKTKLDDVKNALKDVKIVNVRRKPKGLGADLKAGSDFLNNRESIQSLVSLGFYPVQSGANSGELRAANGELHAGVKDGYEYILRFGNIAGTEEGKEGNLNRYMFVVAQLDESRFVEPVLDPLPELPPEPSAPADNKPADNKSTDNRPEDKPAAQSGDACDDTAKAGAEKKADPPDPKSPDPKSPDPKSPDANSPDQNSPDQKISDKKAVDPKADAQKADDKGATPKTDQDEQRAKIKAERERIETENNRKVEEYKKKRKTAEDKVKELNGRFADWYYVISEDVYKKIRVGRNDVIKEQDSAKDEGFGVDAFRKLETEGLKKK